jgi:hypothetical protein
VVLDEAEELDVVAAFAAPPATDIAVVAIATANRPFNALRTGCPFSN